MSELAERARELLNGITPGPWHTSGDGVVWRVEIEAVPDPSDPSGQTPMPMQVQEKVCDTAPGGDAEFIAASPQLVADLSAALERVEKLTDDLESSLGMEGRPSMIGKFFARALRDAWEGK